MLKLTIRYRDEAELRRYLQTVQPYLAGCRPPLSSPGSKGPESDYYRRHIWLDMTGTNAEKPSDTAQNACNTPRGVL